MTAPAHFDQAAPKYEATRGFPPGVGEQVAEAAEALLGAPARVIEIGIGTGRVARPLAARGVRVIGVDLSPAMLAQLRQLAPAGAQQPDLALGDLMHLPLTPAAVDGVLAVHVLHLVPDLPGALAEIRRVLRPGGTLLVGYDGRAPGSPGARVLEHWQALLRERGYDPQAPGARDYAEVTAALRASGGTVHETHTGRWLVNRTAAQAIETIEHRTWAPHPAVPEGFFAGCLVELRRWASAELGGLEQPHPVEHHFVWQACRWLTNAG